MMTQAKLLQFRFSQLILMVLVVMPMVTLSAQKTLAIPLDQYLRKALDGMLGPEPNPDPPTNVPASQPPGQYPTSPNNSLPPYTYPPNYPQPYYPVPKPYYPGYQQWNNRPHYYLYPSIHYHYPVYPRRW